MKILKQRISRIVAFITACILVAYCAFSVTKILLDQEELYNNSNDYLSINQYDFDANELFTELWIIGNMYLRNLDDKGEFIGSPELKSSTESVMQELGLMDSNGNITISENKNLEYYVSWGKNSISNTNKEYDELYDGKYSFSQLNDETSIPDILQYWYNEYFWYNTNYGMTYYYFPYIMDHYAAAVFDFDTTGLNWYIDDNDAKIYYKTDGSTPIPFDGLDYYDATAIEEPNLSQEEIEAIENGYYLIYNSDGKWVHVNNDQFTIQSGNERPLNICITPIDSIIEEHETAIALHNEATEKFLKSLVDLIPLAAIALVLIIYFFIAGGYSIKSGKFIMGKADKIFAELHLLVIGVAFLGCITLISPDVIYEIKDLIESLYSKEMIPVVYSVAYTILLAVIIGLLNSIFIRLKCHKFWKTTLIGKAFIWFISKIKKIIRVFKENTITKDMVKNDIFTKRYIKRSIVFSVLSILTLIIGLTVESLEVIIVCPIFILIGYFYLTLRDLKFLSLLSKQISDMNSGDYSRREVPKDSVIYGMTEKLNNISDGMQNAVERQIKSERMKIDLVTNVSHDLKTPLTSIISYINLLSMEELNPEAADYVKILEQKSNRLSAIVSDLFDLAKATSRTDVKLEIIDAVILVGQVIGDMSDKIKSFGKEIRTDISIDTAPIYAEGKKLYRVLQNLIDNALKYSMNGTRIWLTLYEENNKVVIVLKNISSYEMNFTPEEITERFTRGDESRTSEGNGLGLSIAKSFTEACGGEFKIIIDGDVFAAELKLPITSINTENV